jgi:hypothetical protein
VRVIYNTTIWNMIRQQGETANMEWPFSLGVVLSGLLSGLYRNCKGAGAGVKRGRWKVRWMGTDIKLHSPGSILRGPITEGRKGGWWCTGEGTATGFRGLVGLSDLAFYPEYYRRSVPATCGKKGGGRESNIHPVNRKTRT